MHDGRNTALSMTGNWWSRTARVGTEFAHDQPRSKWVAKCDTRSLL